MANWKVLTLTSVTIGLCGLILVIVLFTATGGYLPFDYGIVLDAGSSHTQITLYHWRSDKQRCTGVVEEVDTCRIEGGISSYNLTDVSVVGQDLMQCVRNVSTKIDKDRLNLSPLYLGATAGMRLLNITAPDRVKSIFDLIRQMFQLKTSLQINTIDIISGQNEGLFSWVTNNYLMNRLVVDKFDSQSTNSTIGMLDMGGASAQIAYRSQDSLTTTGGHNLLSSDDEVKVRLYGINHTVRASSNLCFGVDQAMLRYQAYLVISHNKDRDEPIDSPCLPIGSKLTVSGQSFNNQICVKTKQSGAIDFNKNYTFSGVAKDQDGADCLAVITNHLLDRTKCDNVFDQCFKKEDHPPPNATQFYALSSYYYTVRVLNVTRVTSAAEFLRKTTEFCAQDRDTILRNPLVVPKYVDVYCFQLYYIYTTIKSVYLFGDNQWSNIKFSQTIKNTTLGWSLGFMINATNAIAAEKPTPPVVELLPFVIVCVFCSLILAISIYFGIRWHKSDETQVKEQYEPISISS